MLKVKVETRPDSTTPSKAAQRDFKRRQHLMERSFANAANCHGLKRSRWRGLWRQAIQDLIIATVQNLRKLLRHLTQADPTLAKLGVENRLSAALRALQVLSSRF
jgi:hypothetical protein